jgi:hypothetical protein
MMVRTQDKLGLIKCKQITTMPPHKSEKGWSIIESCEQEYYYILGYYSTQEQCIKVVDMLHNYYRSPHRDYTVFVMPQESEVR